MSKVIVTNEEIQKICKKIGTSIADRYRYAEKPPVFLGVLKGAVNFLVDLTSYVDIPVVIDYIQISSYSGTTTTGTVMLKKDVSVDIHDRDVIIVEDIIDTGISMTFLVDYLKKRYEPKSIITCALLDKTENRKVPFTVDYPGLNIENQFVVGYGLDYNGLFRNTRDIFIPTKEEVASWDKLLEEKK